MKLHVLCILLFLACMYPSLAQGSYENCCLKYASEPKPRQLRKAVSYQFQKTDGGCNLYAVLFYFPRKSYNLCANPNEAWVQSVMKTIDRKNKKV